MRLLVRRASSSDRPPFLVAFDWGGPLRSRAHPSLRARGDPARWRDKVTALHAELSGSGATLSHEELYSRVLDLCPLTPTQASSAARLLEETEQRQKKKSATPGGGGVLVLSPGVAAAIRLPRGRGSGGGRRDGPGRFKRQRPSRLSLQSTPSPSSSGSAGSAGSAGSGAAHTGGGRGDLALLLDDFSRTNGSTDNSADAIGTLIMASPGNTNNCASNSNNNSPTVPIGGTDFTSEDRTRAVDLLGRIFRQQQRRAITDFDLFGNYFNGNRSRRVSLVEFRGGLRKLGIEDFGLGDASGLLFRCIDSGGRGHFRMPDLQSAMKTYKERCARPRRLLSHREDALRKNFDRIANSPTQSSRRWASAQMYSRAFSGAGRDDEKDHDPRKLLAGLARTLRRRTLRDWDIFMMCDEDRNGSVTPMEFATGLHKLHFSFTPRQLKRLWEAIDLDHSGRIEFDELRLALEMADRMGEGTQPGASSAAAANNSTSRTPTAEEALAVESIEDAVGALNDSVDRATAGKKAEEHAIERERNGLILQRSRRIRERISPARLKALLKKMKSALSAWYNHERKSFQGSHGVGGPMSLRHGSGENASAVATIQAVRKSGIAQAVANLSKDLEFYTHGKESEKRDDDGGGGSSSDGGGATTGETKAMAREGAAEPTPLPVMFTVARAKQQMRVMVPFTSKELQAFFVLVTTGDGDESISLDEFDDLLDVVEREMESLLRHAEQRERKYAPSMVSSPARHTSQSMDFTESSGVIEDNLGSEQQQQQQQQQQQVAVRRKVRTSVSDLVQKMQHQMQRSMLFNVALFSGANFSETASARAVRLQLSLLGFHVSLDEASTLLTVFRSDVAGLHFALVARKLQNACYTSIDDTVVCAIEVADPESTGFCPVGHFDLIVGEFVSLTALESKAMVQLLAIYGDAAGIPYADVFCEAGTVKVRGEEQKL